MGFIREAIRFVTPAPILRRQIAETQERQGRVPPRDSLHGQYQDMIDRRTRALKFLPWRRENRMQPRG